jgi:lethal(2) giant larvae protein
MFVVQTTTPTLWVGTNAGTVYVYTVNVPGGERRSKEDVGCVIAKEIQLKHRAPVLSIIILDCNSSHVEGFSPQHDHLGPHKVIISSEEQIKVRTFVTEALNRQSNSCLELIFNYHLFMQIFTLPALRPFGKLKMTAQEGSRLRNLRVQTFVSSADDSYSEKCLSCVTNQGDLYTITVPELRKQIAFNQCLKREDITGISSFTFNEFGEALYQISSSELQRISISSKGATIPRCMINGVFDEPKAESNHVAPVGTSLPTASPNSGVVVDDTNSESGDITIDSVREHVNSSPVPPVPTVSTT